RGIPGTAPKSARAVSSTAVAERIARDPCDAKLTNGAEPQPAKPSVTDFSVGGGHVRHHQPSDRCGEPRPLASHARTGDLSTPHMSHDYTQGLCVSGVSFPTAV
ncbi:MAG: hypothetical protein ACK56I_25970, partial [bacterium]